MNVPLVSRFTQIVPCGDTIALTATDELCNGWFIPETIDNYFLGIGVDSTTLYVVGDFCSTDSIRVDGITDTPTGQCLTSFVYTLTPKRDTFFVDIPCEEFITLNSIYQGGPNSCGCPGLGTNIFTSNLTPCIDCGEQCIFITGITSISGGATEGADVELVYVLDGDTITTGRGDWLGEVDVFDCFDITSDLELLSVQAFVPQGGSGSATAEAWIAENPGVGAATELFFTSCDPNQVGIQTDTLLSVDECDSVIIRTTTFDPIPPTELFFTTCTPAEAGIFFDTLTTTANCDSVLIRNVLLDPSPEVEIFASPACIDEPASLVAFSPTGIEYLWDTGEPTAEILVDEPGSYAVSVTNALGCTTVVDAEPAFIDIQTSLSVSVAGPLLITTQPLEVWEGAAVQLNAQISGTPFPYDIIWNGGPERGDTTLNFVAETSDSITVALIDEIGCFGFEGLPLIVRPSSIFVPSAFSPNGDQINDVFEIYTSPNIAEVRIQLFARNGSLVYDHFSRDPAIEGASHRWGAWTGDFRNQTLHPQVFVYQVRYRTLRGEWKTTSGQLTLTR